MAHIIIEYSANLRGEFDLDGTQFTAYFTSTERIDFRGRSQIGSGS